MNDIDPEQSPDADRQDPDTKSVRWTAGLVVALVVVAVLAAPDRVQAGDSGELATIMLRGGVPHPSGYPWMRILGWLARGLEAVGVAPITAAAWVCATAGIAGWALLHRVALRLGPAPVATVGMGIVAVSPLVVVHTIDAEVWGPLVLATGLVAWLALVRRAGPFALGLGVGLATSHHLTGVLLVPLVVGAAWPDPTRLRALVRAGGTGLGGAMLGLLPYLTLMVGEGGAWRWGDTRTLGGLLHHVSRADYGVFSLSLHTETPAALDQLARVASSVGAALTGGLATPAIAGAIVVVGLLVLAVARPPSTIERAPWLGLLASIVLIVVVFPLWHNIDPTNPFGGWILERFDIMGVALLGVVATHALARLWGLTTRRGLRIGLAACGVLLVARQAAMVVFEGPPSTNDTIERYARDVLRTPEPGAPAIVFGTDDHRLFPILFVQDVLGEGRDVLYVDAALLAHRWYRDRLTERFEGLPTEDKPLRMMARIWEDERWGDTPIFITHPFSRPATRLPRVPSGVLWRVIPPGGDARFGQDRVFEDHLAALQRYPAPLPEPRPGGTHPFADDLAATYTDTTTQLVAALLEGGQTQQARTLLEAFAARARHGSIALPAMPSPDP